MANSFDGKKISVYAVCIVVLAGIVLGYFVYSSLMKNSDTATTSNNEDVELKTDQFKSLTEIKDYGQKVTATEAGYGRDNPFVPVQ
ncbi:MAG: hypothetical protein WC080_04485 [Patescibacteria group bacterium]|jgi:ABC-type Fe3+ transport system permease subunit